MAYTIRDAEYYVSVSPISAGDQTGQLSRHKLLSEKSETGGKGRRVNSELAAHISSIQGLSDMMKSTATVSVGNGVPVLC